MTAALYSDSQSVSSSVVAGVKKFGGDANKLKVWAIWSKLLDPFFSSSERLVNGYFCTDKTEPQSLRPKDNLKQAN